MHLSRSERSLGASKPLLKVGHRESGFGRNASDIVRDQGRTKCHSPFDISSRAFMLVFYLLWTVFFERWLSAFRERIHSASPVRSTIVVNFGHLAPCSPALPRCRPSRPVSILLLWHENHGWQRQGELHSDLQDRSAMLITPLIK